MAEKHLDALFSAAYDDELDALDRRRFDAHLEFCDRCAQGWDDYRAALDAVRALPAVAMPATVRLPVGPPQVEAGRAALLGRLRHALLHPQPVWAAAGLAAVSLAAVILAVHHPGGGTGSQATGSVALGVAPNSHAGTAPVPAVPGARNSAPEAFSAVIPCPVVQVAPGAGGTSGGFSYATRSSVPGGRELVLATPTDTYPPGASVPIYARLTGGGSTPGGNDVVPCVTLQTFGGGAGAPAAAPAPQAAAGSQAQADSPAGAAPPSTPIAVATAQPQNGAAVQGGSAKTATAAGQLRVTIPTGIAHGTRLRLVALIPAESSPTGLPLEIELVITVS